MGDPPAVPVEARGRSTEALRGREAARACRGAQAKGCADGKLGRGGVDRRGERAVVGRLPCRLGWTVGAGAAVMLSVGPTTRVFLRPGATDLRGGFERLYQMARTCFGQDPLEGNQVF